MKLITEGTVEGIATRQDTTITIKFATQELNDSDTSKLFYFRNKYVKLLLSDTKITEIEAGLVDETAITSGKKANSPSKRLRAVMFRMHQDQRITAPFEEWYNNEIERLIIHYKDSLNA